MTVLIRFRATGYDIGGVPRASSKLTDIVPPESCQLAVGADATTVPGEFPFGIAAASFWGLALSGFPFSRFRIQLVTTGNFYLPW